MKQPGTWRSRRAVFHGGALAALGLVAFAAYGLLIPGGSPYSSSSSPASAQSPAAVKPGAPAPDFAFTTVDGSRHRLSEFRGRPVMFWLYASWCPTCQVGTRVVAQNFDRLKQSGVQIIQLQLYDNLGYPGPSVADFASRHAESVAPSPSWLWGEASREVSFTYDPRGYPDIYFLIGEDGVIQTIAPAPHVTMDRILAFAQSVD